MDQDVWILVEQDRYDRYETWVRLDHIIQIRECGADSVELTLTNGQKAYTCGTASGMLRQMNRAKSQSREGFDV